MPGAFPSDGPYSITVSTQPTGLNCSVANGSGMIGGANVTNVQITCAITSYTIGGSIDFLFDAGGLIVQNNGGDATQIPANSTSFTMPTTLVGGSPYPITILSQPLGRSCTVSNGSETIGSANVTSVPIRCCGNTGLRLPPGGMTGVGYSGACNDSCPQVCAEFARPRTIRTTATLSTT
jgi:hypothetical protein